MSHDQDEPQAGTPAESSLSTRFKNRAFTRVHDIGKRVRDLSGAEKTGVAALIIGTGAAVLCRRQIAGALRGVVKGKRRTGLRGRFARH